MILHITVFVLTLLQLLPADAENSTTPNRTKSKRAPTDQIYHHGDAKAVLFYMENPQVAEPPELQAAASTPEFRNFYPNSAKPLALVSVQQPIQVFEQDSPKQVAEQQVLYEFQQTPTNAVSNVHVKQLFEPNTEVTSPNPLIETQPSNFLPTVQSFSSIQQSTPAVPPNPTLVRPQPQALGLSGLNSNHAATSATIVSPVHHNLFTNHGLNSASFSYHNPQHPGSQQYLNTQITPKQVPGKYIYLNGKIIYNPTHIVPQEKVFQNSLYQKGVYHNQQKLPLINYAQKHNVPAPQLAPAHRNLGPPRNQHVARPQGNLPVAGYLPPITKNRFQAPQRLHQIDKPSAPVRQQVEEERDEREEQANEESDEESDDGEEDAATENREDEKEHNNEDDDDGDDDRFAYETFPFEEDDYHEDDESHYFKHPKQYRRKNKGRNSEEESDYDRDDDRQDAKRGASKQYSKYHHHPGKSRKYRNPPKYDKGENYGFYEGYSTNSKYESPKHGKKNAKKDKHEKPTGKYKKVKYSKVGGSKPKVETIEGRFSENMPVVHKQKVYKERWYVSKDVEGSASKNPPNNK